MRVGPEKLSIYTLKKLRDREWEHGSTIPLRGPIVRHLISTYLKL